MGALTATVDLHSTIAEVAGAAHDAPHGRSLLPLLDGAPGPDALLYGTFGQGVCCTDGEWTIFKSPPGRGSLYAYSSLLVESQDIKGIGTPVEHGLFVPGVPLPQWRIPAEVRPLSHEDFLFHRPTDPAQERNLWDAEPAQRERMLDLLRALVESEGAPPEQLVRLGLQA